MADVPIEDQILESIEKARHDVTLRLEKPSSSTDETKRAVSGYFSFPSILSSPAVQPDHELTQAITENFSLLNRTHQTRHSDSSYVFLQDLQLSKIQEDQMPPKEHQPGKVIVGGAMVIAGQPILRKRFVMAGSAEGTSIASKYLSRILPQRMPTRVMGTRVLGRAIGRTVPFIGWALIVIDVVELLVEVRQANNHTGRSFSGGGGSFGGGGASGSW